MATSITYNSVNLNDGTIYVLNEIEDAHTPNRDLQVFNILRGAGAVVTDSNYYSKNIKVSGKLIGTSVTNLESRIDTLHSTLSNMNKNLDIGYNSTTRRYVCTPASVMIRRPVRAAAWAEFEIDFLATEYGKDTTTSTLINAVTHTTASNTTSISPAGSAPDQQLRIQITVTAATGLTTKTIGVENDTTGELVEITRDWTVGDVLIIDCNAKTVKVNGTSVVFEGPFPIFAPGTHNLIITNDFTTRTLTVTVDYTKRYL